MKLKAITEIDVTGQRILLREDFNVPLSSSGDIQDDTRIKLALPTLKYLLEKKCKIGIMSHLGRPNPDNIEQKFSLLPIAKHLEDILKFPVKLTSSFNTELNTKHITLFENVRFLKGETSNDTSLSKTMAKTCDVFIMDAFATSHRKHASTYGVSKFAPRSLAGPLLINEIKALSKAIISPQKPIVAIIGGAKISSKLPLLQALVQKVDHLILGGGIANTLLKAKGFDIGKSFYEPDLVEQAYELIQQNPSKIPLPIDVLVSKDIQNDKYPHPISIENVLSDDIIGDVGPKTTIQYCHMIDLANTIIWNGPLGIFEIDHFARSTISIAHKIAQSKAFSLVGGGETITAINQEHVENQISYISTGGGAFLTFLKDANLPILKYLLKI